MLVFKTTEKIHLNQSKHEKKLTTKQTLLENSKGSG